MRAHHSWAVGEICQKSFLAGLIWAGKVSNTWMPTLHGQMFAMRTIDRMGEIIAAVLLSVTLFLCKKNDPSMGEDTCLTQ